MQEYGITTLQTKPSLFKEMTISKIVDKRGKKDIGYFISAKYKDMLIDTLRKIEKKERISQLERLKEHQDMEFLELGGVDDGLM